MRFRRGPCRRRRSTSDDSIYSYMALDIECISIRHWDVLNGRKDEIVVATILVAWNRQR